MSPDLIHNVAEPPERLASSYQSHVLKHWSAIRGADGVPLRKDFRPQKFANHLIDLAVVGATTPEEPTLKVRLMGSALKDKISLSNGLMETDKPWDESEEDSMRSLFVDSLLCRSPAFGTFWRRNASAPLGASADPYNVLVLPFVETKDELYPSTLIAAFDFNTQR